MHGQQLQNIWEIFVSVAVDSELHFSKMIEIGTLTTAAL